MVIQVKNNEKIIVILGVLIMLTFLVWIFLTVFKFEKNSKIDTFNVTDEEVAKVYEINSQETDFARYTFYSGYKIDYDDLAYDYVATLAYQELLKENKLSTDVTIDDLKDAGVAINIRDVKPLYKITVNSFNEKIKYLFGNNITIENTSFKINNNLFGCLSSDKENIYIYEENSEEEEKYYVLKEFDSYGTQDNGKTLVIYDYFIKCNKETKDCFNDDRMAMPNHYLKYENNVLSNLDKSMRAKYEHTYKWDNDHYYWVSSELIAN